MKGGYLDGTGTPTAALLGEIEFTDKAIGNMVQELKNRGLYESTLVVITAKHGQNPIDSSRYVPILKTGTSRQQSSATRTCCRIRNQPIIQRVLVQRKMIFHSSGWLILLRPALRSLCSNRM